MRHISLLLGLTLSLSFVFAHPAAASFCRNINGHSICIVSIKRSAKNYWEYRASVSIDGVVKPIEQYNCRRRVRIQKDGAVIQFALNGPGELICNLLYRTHLRSLLEM